MSFILLLFYLFVVKISVTPFIGVGVVVPPSAEAAFMPLGSVPLAALALHLVFADSFFHLCPRGGFYTTCADSPQLPLRRREVCTFSLVQVVEYSTSRVVAMPRSHRA